MSQRLTLNDIQVGQVYEHILNGDYVLAIETGNEQVKIRTKSFMELYVYPWELCIINNGYSNGYSNNGYGGGGFDNGPRRNNGGRNNNRGNRW